MSYNPNSDELITLKALGVFKKQLDSYHWYGTEAELEEDDKKGLIPVGCICHVTDDFTPSDYYTKSDVDVLVSKISKLSVDPSYSSLEEITDPQENKVYLILDSSGKTLYSEYMYYDNKWCLIATQPQTGVTYTDDGTLYI